MALTVNSSTRLEDLQAFSSSMDQNSRLVAKRAKDGSGAIILYQSANAEPGLWSRLSGKAAEKRALARQAVEQTLANAFPSTRATDVTLCSVRKALNAPKSGEVKAGQVAVLAKLATTAHSRETWLARANIDPLKWSVLESGFTAAGDTSAAGNASREALARNTGKFLASFFRGDREAAQKFALGDGDLFKGELHRMIDDAVGKGNALANLSDPEVRDFLNSVFYATCSELLPDRMEGDRLRLGTTDYRFSRQVGDDARIRLFSGPGGKQVIVKLLPNPDKETNERLRLGDYGFAQREVTAFQAATTAPHSNILGYEGVFRTASGEIGIAMEFAPHGTVEEISRHLEKAVSVGSVSKKAAMAVKIEMLRDMVRGMTHLNEAAGVLHLDFKPSNCFVGQAGVCKVADFGRSIGADKYNIAMAVTPASKMYVAPEAIAAGEELSSGRTDGRLDHRAIKELFPKSVGGPVNRAITMFNYELEKRTGLMKGRDMAIDGRAVDAWALGSAMFTVVFGRHLGECQPVDEKSSFWVEESLAAFAASPENRVIDKTTGDWGPAQGNNGGDASVFAGSSGNEEIDDLINGLMHPVPKKRMKVEDAADHALFAQPAAGSAECRALLVALSRADADPTHLKNLSMQVEDAL